jgi:hypothetical protein
MDKAIFIIHPWFLVHSCANTGFWGGLHHHYARTRFFGIHKQLEMLAEAQCMGWVESPFQASADAAVLT